ncbi:amidohydrolase family protein [Pseudanabaena sp. PCC 6802]|uniref:amidohydrolase family protein n=1 Tax=Pseudanabaena sp. PCC 6802 TaxID=118173 RepID=UPI000348C887|nr:amidohydrolase family protein [Pseudanabaena sp. PCC 6802]
MIIHNCHTHIFTFEAVPEYFVPFGLVRFFAKYKFFRPIARLLNRLNPFSTDDLFDRYAAFISTGALDTQEKIFNQIQKFYPGGSRFVVLSMDMTRMDAGESEQSFEQQLTELAQLKQNQKYSELILPFICLDPRRDGVVELGLDYLEKQNFAGIKLYAPLGYYPYDSRLNPVYRYAEDKRIPIITHTSPAGVYYRGGDKKLKSYLQDFKFDGIDVEEIVEELKRNKRRNGNDRQKICSFFAHPVQYLYLLKQYPRLKIDFAHFGGNEDWDDYIENPLSHDDRKKYDEIVREIRDLLNNDSRTEQEQEELKQKIKQAFGLNWLYLILQMLKAYDNVYADISYTLNDEKYFSFLKVLLQDPQLRPKILFGSDYYMVQMATSEKKFSLDLRGYLGEVDYQQIAEINPKAFFGES